MKLKFNPNLDYQQDAIASTLGVFEGLSTAGEAYREKGIANTLDLNPQKLLNNLHTIQEQNFIEKTARLFTDDDDYPFPIFQWKWRPAQAKPMSTCVPFLNCTNAWACENLSSWCHR